MVNRKKVAKLLEVLDKKTTVDLAAIENELPKGNRVVLSNLRNTKTWLPLLTEFHTIEVISGSETVAQINAPDLVPTLINEIKVLQREVEVLEMNSLYGYRVHEKNLLGGEELAGAASKALEAILAENDDN